MRKMWFKSRSKAVEEVEELYSSISEETEKLNIDRLVEEHEERVEEEKKPKEMIDISVSGNYKFEVKNMNNEYAREHWFVLFSYKVTIKFLEEELKVDSTFSMTPRNKPSYQPVYHNEETTYEWLSETLESGAVMERLKVNIMSDINEYVRKKNIAKLKEAMNENNSFDIDISFQAEKSHIREIK